MNLVYKYQYITKGVLPFESLISGSSLALSSSSRNAALPVPATVSKFIDIFGSPSTPSSPPSNNKSPRFRSLSFLLCCRNTINDSKFLHDIYMGCLDAPLESYYVMLNHQNEQLAENSVLMDLKLLSFSE